MTTGPTGAVCVAVFRPSPDSLRTQLESIAAQSHQDWTCFVGIDGADPSTLALVLKIVGDDPRFEVHEFKKNVGFYRNFERTIELAVDSGAEWIALADQDDYWYSNKLQRLLQNLAPGVAVVSGQARVVNELGQLLSTTERKFKGRLELLLDNQVTGSLSLFTRDVARTAIPFPEPTTAAYHDHWLGLCGLTIGRVVFVGDTVQDYVQHSNNVLGEERGIRIASRLGRLSRRPDGTGRLEFIAHDRWGWRVRMAQLLVERRELLPADRHLRVIACDRTSFTILLRILCAMLHRRVPLLRGMALASGLIARPWFRCKSVSEPLTI